MLNPGLIFTKQLIKHVLKGNLQIPKQIRYYKRWKGSMTAGRSAVGDRCPWLSYPAIDFLNHHLKKEDLVFEYGAGGSTLFFLERVGQVVTVEHDSRWFKLLQDSIPVNSRPRWSGHLILPEEASDTGGFDKSSPDDYFSGNPLYQQSTFRDYCRFIDRFRDENFDLVLIDGRARTSCFQHAVCKVKPGGYLILDNSERSHYLSNNKQLLQNRFRTVLQEMAPAPYDPSFSRTSIWKRI
jgi:hypothetical protein